MKKKTVMLICALYLYIDRYWLYLQLLLNYSTKIIQKLVNKQFPRSCPGNKL